MGGSSDRHTLQEIFQRSFADFARSHRLRRDVLHAAYSILTCRTAARGGHVQRCPEGHVESAWYNSCLHRSCPQCGFSKLMDWLEAKKSLLLPCGHFHLTFGFPSELHGLWRANRKRFGNLFFQVAAASLREALGKPRFLVGRSGFLLSLHTWNRRLGLHPHMHCLVTAGALTEGRWSPARIRKWLLPTEGIRLVYRRRMTGALARLLRKNRLRLPPQMTRDQALELVASLANKPWIVDRRQRYPHGAGIATYLARYLRGGPIRNRRLRAIGNQVSFVISRKGDDERICTLPVAEFLRRLLDHVPPKGFRAIRGYGLYAHTAENEREQARALLLELHPDRSKSETLVFPARPDPREKCPICGRHLVPADIIPRARPGPWLGSST